MHAQKLANKLLPGLGHLLSLLVVLGGLAFNIGNIAGAGLGVNVLAGINVTVGALISAGIAVLVFWFKDAGKAMDMFAKLLGFVMIALTVYVADSADPPLQLALKHSFLPEKIDTTAILTLVGGTVGGYISFAGIHRLLQAILDLNVPTYRHHLLLTNAAGERLSKRDEAVALRAMRQAGRSAAEVRALAGFSG